MPNPARSTLESQLALQLRAVGVPDYQTEYRFAAHHVELGPGVRERLKLNRLQDWRFDFAWPDIKFAAEVEGGNWIGGRHNTGKGFEDDLRKYHAAMDLGWTVYRCGSALIKSGEAVQLIAKIVNKW